MEPLLPLTIIIHFLKRTIMKRIFTLMFAVGLMGAAIAQPGNRDNRQPGQQDNRGRQQENERFDNDRQAVAVNISFDNDDFRGNNRFANERKRDALIAKINREYDYRIQRVRNSFFLDRWEKMQKIRFLEDQRRQEIRMVYMQFSKRNHRDGRYDNRHRF
jgi:hypothetical protein